MEGREVDLLWRFKRSGKLSGWFIREVPVGLSVRGRPPMRIDAICVEGDPPRFLTLEDRIPTARDSNVWTRVLRSTLQGRSVWILEVKRELNAEALGQILIYEYWFKKDNPDIHVKGKGIICERRTRLIEEVCRKYSVKVFVV